MLTILAFLITIIGSINWLLIGLLQYDFVAGIFGYQGSVFSRLIYIIIGASCIVLVVKLFKGRGTIAVFSRRNKKDLEKQLSKIGKDNASTSSANVEASREMDDNSHFGRSNFDLNQANRSADNNDSEENGLFDEHFKD